MTVVLAFDGDEAGLKAGDEALLTLLEVTPTVRSFLRSYVFERDPFEKAIAYLSNAELFEEYRWEQQGIGVDWGDPEFSEAWSQQAHEHVEACLAQITERSTEAAAYASGAGSRSSVADRFNLENTVSEVLGQFDIQVRPGRTIKCPIHDDRSPSLTVFSHDHRVFCHNPACPLNGGGKGERAYMLYRLLAERQSEGTGTQTNPGP